MDGNILKTIQKKECIRLLNLGLNFVQAAVTTKDVADDSFVMERMAGITRYVYENFATVDATGHVDYAIPGYITFAMVFILSAIVYKMGFAKPLKIWQNVVIYIFLFVGCVILTFFAFFLPMVEGLMVAALILIVYKSRMWRDKRAEKKAIN